MDAVGDERGQALVVAVLFLAIAAAALGGIRVAQDRVLAEARARRAGEAAVEAATAVIADAYARADLSDALVDPRAREDARAAALAISMANGGGEPGAPAIACGPRGIDVAIALAGRTYRAGFEAACSRR
jgi:hypothetical protein